VGAEKPSTRPRGVLNGTLCDLECVVSPGQRGDGYKWNWLSECKLAVIIARPSW
jgi:hypothetical protein